MSKSKNTNPNVFRSKWDMAHSSDADYSRSRVKKELEETLSEMTGSLEEDDPDLKPFWELDSEETEEEEREESV